MRSLAIARARARERRAQLITGGGDLISALTKSLWDDFSIQIVAVSKLFLRGSAAEVVPSEGFLYYDCGLDGRPQDKLEVLAHEYGHLVLHHKHLTTTDRDFIRGSAFLDTGSAAVSRYSPRSQEEAEAAAFATELICPAAEVFERWRQDPGSDLEILSEVLGVSEGVVRQQLAEGLFNQQRPPLTLPSSQTFIGLSSEQERAAYAIGTPVLVDAGPGTGKTRTLISRAAWLIAEKAVDPSSILILTFSTEAANELRERVSLLDTRGQELMVQTFHGFGVTILHLFGHHIGLETDLTILDEASQEELLSDVIGQVDCEAILDIREPQNTVREVTSQINYLKDRLIDVDALWTELEQWKRKAADADEYARGMALHSVFRQYEKIKQSKGYVDFADLIIIPHHLLREHDEVRENLRAQFPWVLVDEYQDVSRATALFLMQICGESNPPWVVGDARQAIYRFRGAEPANIIDFEKDFPGARTFKLTENYRSAEEIVRVANNLAKVMNKLGHGTSDSAWEARSTYSALGNPPVRIAQAESDNAEYGGIVSAVQEWLGHGVKAADIAVLARRNLDVRRIAIALKRARIRSVTSGLITAEGAGGDLAAVTSIVDGPAFLPRLVYALRRNESVRQLNRVIAALCYQDLSAGAEPEWMLPEDDRAHAQKVWTLIRRLREGFHSSDAWTLLCDFLFFSSPYLRDLLAEVDSPEAAVQLEEVLSTLALAAVHRMSHRHDRPRWSRRGFSDRLRELVTTGTPGVVPPAKVDGAVQVMTCHASKGQEFPCVVVAGQSLTNRKRTKQSLPPSMRQNEGGDIAQAESLLFVGATRARRALLVSFASSATARPRSRRREISPLLKLWMSEGNVAVYHWPSANEPSNEVEADRMWGGTTPGSVSPYSLSEEACQLRTYLEDQLALRTRDRIRPLYPEFTSRVRKMLGAVVEKASAGMRVEREQVADIVEQIWPATDYQNHPHILLYRPRAVRWVERFAAALDPRTLTGHAESSEVAWAGSSLPLTVKLNLVAHILTKTGRRTAILHRVGKGGKPALNWSELDGYRRLPFVLLQSVYGNLSPYVVFEDGEMLPFKWRKSKPVEKVTEEAESARQRAEDLVGGRFTAMANEWDCDQCRCRLICPYWIGAVPGEEDAS